MTDRELLAEVLAVTALSARKFARLFLARDERTMRRWEAGDSPVPAVVLARLQWLIALPAAQRAALVRILLRD